MSSQPEYDAIVIGSGMGGLAFASIMAKLRKWRVLVLGATSRSPVSRRHSHGQAVGPGM
jgi:choline dehydrogenase-like flavoprotein